MKISVFVPTIRPDTLPFAIQSILQQRWTNWELVIVAQGAYPLLEPTVEAAAKGDARIRIVRMQKFGVSLARNMGITSATGDVIAMMDDDCEAQADWLEIIAESFTRYSDVSLVSGALLAPARTRRGLWMCPQVDPPEAFYDPILTPQTPPKGWKFVSANCAVRYDSAVAAGPFDPYLGTGGHFCAGEETDWALRLERLNVKMYSSPRMVVKHTYGIRYGLRAVLRMSGAYARGNGAVAGKLTLMGDARGRKWLRDTRRECTLDIVRDLRLHRLPVSLNRLRVFEAAYNECVSQFCVDSNSLLQQRHPLT